MSPFRAITGRFSSCERWITGCVGAPSVADSVIGTPRVGGWWDEPRRMRTLARRLLMSD